MNYPSHVIYYCGHRYGRRDDVADNLYRIAPLNGRIGLFYDTDEWLAGTEILVYDDQNETANFNDEVGSRLSKSTF